MPRRRTPVPFGRTTYSCESVALMANRPLDDRSWHAMAHETSPTDEGWFLQVNAVCAAA